MTRARRFTWRERGDRGSYSVETVILAPAIIGLMLLMIAFGRVTDASGAVESAARAAARAASLERDAGTAQAAGSAAAARSLTGEGIRCASSSVSVDTSGYSLDLGQDATVRVTVSCTAPLGEIGLPGLPGSRTLQSSWTSPIDSYRGRQ
ncbi:TadE/TadG family type IV pilus assembly protein [Streptomyces sp. NPDC056883]|uniref:TadE/TadG family type IV pilus assembly protein n=1 Tax=Streptomyces sp. NPDC056883 TaxID=3345959 RepID=UPI00368107E5